jgi:hypothetical protein
LRSNRQDLAYLGAIILTLLLAAGLTWVNYQFASQSNPGDSFAPLWAGARQVITRLGNPYDRQAAAGFLPPGVDTGSRFVYPFYGMLVFLPFGLITSYTLAKAVWMTVMMACLVAVTFAGISLTRWNPSGRMLVVFVIFSLSGYHAMRAIYTGNPAILIAMLVAFGLQMVIQGRDWTAGIIFGLTIIKPTMVALLLPYVFLYAVSKRKMALISSMLITMIVLITAAFLVYPRWLVQNFAQVVYLYRESFPSSITAVFASWFPDNTLMIILASGFGLWLIVEWWRSLGKNSRWFLWTAALTLVFTELIGIPTSTANYTILIIPLTLSFSILEQRWKSGGAQLVLVFMIVILTLTWGAYLMITGSDPSQPEPLFLFFPLPILALLLLYWVRYWALSSVKLRVEHLEALRKL